MQVSSLCKKACIISNNYRQYLFLLVGSKVYISKLPKEVEFSRVESINDEVRVVSTKGLTYYIVDNTILKNPTTIKFELIPYIVDLTEIFAGMQDCIECCKDPLKIVY